VLKNLFVNYKGCIFVKIINMDGQILIQNEDETFEYVDFWFNENKIIGYYLSKDNYEDESVNLIITNGTLTVKRSKELIDYLLTKFN